MRKYFPIFTIYALIVILALVSANGVHALVVVGSGGFVRGADTVLTDYDESEVASGQGEIMSTGDLEGMEVDIKIRSSKGRNDRYVSRVDVSIELSNRGDSPLKAVNVVEYLPRGLFKDTGNGVFIDSGLMWNKGIIEKNKTVSYTIHIPKISRSTTYELRTVVEYQNYDDLMTLGKTCYLTVNPQGQARTDNCEVDKSVEETGKGYSHVHWARPNFKAAGKKVNVDVGKGNGDDKEKDKDNGGNGKGDDSGGNDEGNGKGKGGKK